MARWMPVLREDHPPEFPHQAVYDGQNRIGIRHCESAAIAEVVLDINDDKDGIHVRRVPARCFTAYSTKPPVHPRLPHDSLYPTARLLPWRINPRPIRRQAPTPATPAQPFYAVARSDNHGRNVLHRLNESATSLSAKTPSRQAPS